MCEFTLIARIFAFITDAHEVCILKVSFVYLIDYISHRLVIVRSYRTTPLWRPQAKLWV